MSSSTTATVSLDDYVGRGVHLYVGGVRYVDCASGTFNLSLGYSQPQIVAALHEQLDRCLHLSSEFTGPKSAEIFELLRPVLPPHIGSYWFRDITGSTANECAVRIAQKATGRSDVISLFLSHHGQSATATGISGNAFRQQSFALPVVGSVKIPAPDCANCFYGQTRDRCGLLCARRLEDFVEYASSGRVAALIIEPIMGNGGNIVPDPEYFAVVREICDRHGILVIADEVQTGFGRTGTFFASTGFARALRPDIITFAKGAGGVGIPVAGVLMRPELDVLEPWEHSSTSGANPLSLVALEQTVRYLREHDVLASVNRTGALLKQGLQALESAFEPVRNVRGEGLMLAFDLPTAWDANRFIRVARGHGLILRGSRYGFGTAVKVRPPLIVTEADVEEILAGLRAALTEFEKGL